MGIITLFYTLLCHLVLQANSNHIAVCVGGQLARWIPRYLHEGLILPNPHIQFSIFINLQYHTRKTPWVYNTDSHLIFHPTSVSNMGHAELIEYVNSLYDTDHSRFVSFTSNSPIHTYEWAKKFNNTLDRISQYKSAQTSILNMYYHQDKCMKQINYHEQFMNMSFTHVLSTREDIFYFRPMDLSFVLSLFTSKGSKDFSNCDIVTKECLAWSGLHMRWQLARRNASEFLFGKRFDFYEHLIKQSQEAYNPERYELAQVKHYQLHVCELLIDHIPNAVVRHIKDGHICFLRPEIIDNCVPKENDTFVSRHLCNHVPKTYRVFTPS